MGVGGVGKVAAIGAYHNLEGSIEGRRESRSIRQLESRRFPQRESSPHPDVMKRPM
jgi:hypothetical protein